VLKPGGLFFASTFLKSSFISRSSGFKLFDDVDEIRDFLGKAGFREDTGSAEVRKEGIGCAIIKARKSL
jgi:hypothetical protein